ncbi:MAG: hypothetical protein ACFHWX_05140 [Bacteroidota bacterium]
MMKLLQRGFRILLYILGGLFSLFVLIILFKISPALWNRWVVYPQLEKERAALWDQYKKPEQAIPLSSYNGVLHAHTFWSHDSRGLLPEILDGAKQAGLKFIFNSDHKRSQLDTFPRGYQGVYDGIIIESGTEHSTGLMISPFDSVVVDWNKPESDIMRDISQNGGLVTYVHSEDPHHWESPYYQAMEIYNIHTDLKDEDGGILAMMINGTINGGKYRHWAFREIFDEQTAILQNWDRLNENRRVVGIAGVDAHNNQNFRAHRLENGLIEWVGPNADTLVIREPNWFDKLMMGEPDKYGWAFKWELDPYFNSYNFSNDYVFCDSLTNTNIRDNIKKGHVFVSFEHLAKGQGFQYFALNSADSLTAILGDSVSISQVNSLKVLSPYPAKFQLFKDGAITDESEPGYEYSYSLNGAPGNYRIVARVLLDDQWLPWIYTNPIYIY